MAPRSGSLALVEPRPPPLPGPISVDITELAPGVSMENGALKVVQPDGSIIIDFNPTPESAEGSEEDFYRNLANEMDDAALDEIASNLLEGIIRDEDSRREWLATRAKGITLLGLTMEEPTQDIGGSSAPLEGMSKIRHPLLLDATVRFQANARSELLPASGPVKIRNDSTVSPVNPLQDGGSPISGNALDELAQSLEKDFNHYLTVVAKEYVPDTDRMLFYIGFGGDGFKKVFNCPLRRRPVSESVDAENLIVSNSATALADCGRVTHKISMRKSILRRMQILGSYRNVPISTPAPTPANAVDQKKNQIDGFNQSVKRPEDSDYTIYETYCELDIDEYAPKKFKGEGLPLPYRVTIEKDSRKVLSVIRNWREDDDQCLAKQFFVQFPFIRGLGFYGLGFIHLLGNTTNTLTAAWREVLDAGMFASFPGFLYVKSLGRQNTNQFRVPPGGGVAIDPGPLGDIRTQVMPLPYKEAGPGLTAFIGHVEEVGQRLGMTPEITVGEGKQDAPVGTTMALIEQATKPLDAVHKRMHAAQAEEFSLLKERFKEDPEAFWRHTGKTYGKWDKEKFLLALENNDLVPVADPNNPTSLHRVAKAAALKELQKFSPELYNKQAVDLRIMRIVGIDPAGLFNETPTPAPPDPRLEAVKEKAKANQMQQMVMDADSKRKLQIAAMQLQSAAQDRASKERIEHLRVQIEQLRLAMDANESATEIAREWEKVQADLAREQAKCQGEMQVEAIRGMHDIHKGHQEHLSEMDRTQRETEMGIAQTQREHEAELERDRQKHIQAMMHQDQMHEAKLAHARALAEVAKKSKATKSSGGK